MCFGENANSNKEADAVQRAKMDISFFLLNVYEAATVSSHPTPRQCTQLTMKRVCTAVKEEFSPKHYLPYLPDTNFVMCSYAVSFLKAPQGFELTGTQAIVSLKIVEARVEAISRLRRDNLQASFVSACDRTWSRRIADQASEVADLLEECAIDPSHQPAIYAAFIREIVRKTKESRLQPGSSRAGSPAINGQNFDLLNTTTGGQGQMAQPPVGQVYDPTLMGDWGNETMEAPQFTFIPQGGDMM